MMRALIPFLFDAQGDVPPDLGQFRHIPHAVALVNYQLAAQAWDLGSALRAEVRAWNPPAVVDLWELELGWRLACWDHLETIRNPTYGSWPRKHAYRELLRLLGPEAYYAGHMPMPIPSYRK